MPEYTFDEGKGLLVVAHEGREVYRVTNLPHEKLKETLQTFLVKSDDGSQFAFIDESRGFEAKPAELEVPTITLIDCPAKECPRRIEHEIQKGSV
jgi:hypothetical protein